MELFDAFPNLEDDTIVIRKMVESDVDALMEITNSDNVYRYIPPSLYRKSRGNILAAIRNLGGRDFDKKKKVIAGIYLKEAPDHLVGLAEMFDYKKRANEITIGYRLNEYYWNRGIATGAVRLMTDYLINEVRISTLLAYVMPENINSGKVLLKNGFVKREHQEEKSNWGGREKVTVDVYSYTKR